MKAKRFLADLALFVVLAIIVWPIVWLTLVAMAHGEDLKVEYALEPDASIEESLTDKHVELLVALTRVYGYRCDTVRVARPLVWSYGYKLVCNGYRYSYLIEDKGGQWTVTLD